MFVSSSTFVVPGFGDIVFFGCELSFPSRGIRSGRKGIFANPPLHCKLHDVNNALVLSVIAFSFCSMFLRGVSNTISHFFSVKLGFVG
jgi:hypothetical protein